METSVLSRHQIIERLMALHPEKGADAVADLWEQLATQIISIVGEDGFYSLYSRSIFLALPTFPWLAASSPPLQAGHRFAQLKKSFEGQTMEEVSSANRLLLMTFTDILAALIGEELTTSILQLAWGNNVMNSAGREFDNE